MIPLLVWVLEYPKNTHLTARAENLSRPGERSCTKHVDPNTRTGTAYRGSLGNKSEYGISLPNTDDGMRFIK